jgi:membrane associated rhomboid family serine protease
LLLVAIFWIVELAEVVGHTSFTTLGILPRTLSGLVGIFLAPFLHGGFYHLFSNSTTFIMLGTSMMYFYPESSKRAFPYLYLVTGLGVWFFGRGQIMGGHPVYHIGASGLVYAFAAFLFFNGVFRRDRRSWAISFSVALLYHGLLYSLVPSEPGISWESHLSGFVVGFVCAFVFRSHDPDPIRPSESDDGPVVVEEGFQPLENRHFRYHFQPKKKP